MPTLEQIQASLIATIREGPDALDPELFEGPIDRVLLGLQTHAATIHRARLVALETCFPRTRAALGEEAFRAACNAYVETAEARACELNWLGREFPNFLHLLIGDANIIETALQEWKGVENSP
ncbi:MAG: HvfC/BufC family peptide modification chaperone [Sphingorhabdus sp.]